MGKFLETLLSPDNNVTLVHLADAKIRKEKISKERDKRKKFELEMAQFYSPSYFLYETIAAGKETVKTALDIFNIFRAEFKKK